MIIFMAIYLYLMSPEYKLQAWVSLLPRYSLLSSVEGMSPGHEPGCLKKVAREPSTQVYREMRSVNSCHLLQTLRSSRASAFAYEPCSWLEQMQTRWTLPTGYLFRQQMLRVSEILQSWKPLWTSGSFTLNVNKPGAFAFVLTGHTLECQNRPRHSALGPLEEGRPGQFMRSSSLCQGSVNSSPWATCSLSLTL